MGARSISGSGRYQLFIRAAVVMATISSLLVWGVSRAPTASAASPPQACSGRQLQATSVPPIGAPVDTIGSGRDVPVSINGRDYAPLGPSQNLGMRLVIVDRCTLSVQASFYTEYGRDLQAIQKKIADLDARSLVILQYPIGLVASNSELSFFNDRILGAIGAPPITQKQTEEDFSVIGGRGWQANTAFTNFGRTFPGKPEGDLSGYLRVNPVTGRYDFVFADYVAFATQAASPSPSQNTVQVGANTYTDSLPAAPAAGFQVVELDSVTLQVQSHQAFQTNTGNAPFLAGQQQLASALGSVVADPNIVVVIQSIGNPGGPGRTPTWATIGNEIAKLGGTSSVFNALDGTGGYALVGRAGMVAPPAEVSQPLTGQPPRLQGFFARSQSSSFDPMVANATTTANFALLSLTYQPPTPFPAFSTEGQRNAETYIGIHIMKICQSGATSCDVRAAYYQRYNGVSWQTINTRLADRTAYPCTNGPGFTVADCETVRTQLSHEVGDLTAVQHYLGGLQRPFGTAEVAGLVDLTKIGGDIQRAVDAPTDAQTKVHPLQVMSLIFKIGAALPPPLNNVASGLSAAMALAAYFMPLDNSASLLGPAVAARAGQLGVDMFNRYQAASTDLDTIGKIVASDYGKLTSMASKVDTDDPAWQLPENIGQVVESMRQGADQWFYQSLLPVAYSFVTINPAPPDGPATAAGYTCFSSFGGNNSRSPNTSNPLRNEPASGQDRQIVGFRGNGDPIAPVIALTKDISTNPFGVPPASLTDPLFRSIDDPSGAGVGFTKAQLYSPRYFKFTKTLNNNARCPYG